VKKWWRALHRHRNPLWRRVDRAEALGRITLIAVVLVACGVLVPLIGRWTDTTDLRQAHAEQQSWRPVAATLEQSASQSIDSAEWNVAWVEADWQLPGGQRRSGAVAVPLNARAGQHVRIWIDAAGQEVSQPLTTASVREQVIFTVLSLLLAIAVAAGAAAAAGRLFFDRRRMANWQREWDMIGPSWSRRR
jgi:hypothetical protein